ncbi:MAG: hypothetical protein LBC41_12885 [Clostridiales bacterium]|jgi:tetratricopeptide (TPR) repeat protein|nr:hypothetical protein [Clostridiales bacterium]MDR2751546.1 hypothetical protein [Clostridiales bacterium]
MFYAEAALIGITALKEGQPEKALRYLDMALSAVDVNEVDEEEKKFIVLIKQTRGIAYSRTGNLEASMRQMEEALELDNFESGDKVMDNATKINAAIAFADMGKMEKALEYADSVSIISMPKNMNAATTLLALATVYAKNLETRGDKAKMALLKAKGIFEEIGADKEELFESLSLLYKGLAEVALKHDGDKGKMLGYCSKGWSLAKKIGLEKVKHKLFGLAELCNLAIGNTTEEDEFFWNVNTIEVSSKMLEVNSHPVLAATLYINASLSLYPRFVAKNAELNPQLADLCLEILSDGSEPEIVLATAQWLCAYKHSREGRYYGDRALSRKMTSLLRMSAKTLEKYGTENTSVYASIKSIMADVHFSRGEYALSAQEYKLAGSIYVAVFGGSNARAKYCEERMKAAIAAMKDSE